MLSMIEAFSIAFCKSWPDLMMRVDAGKACIAFHDEQVRNVKAQRVQVDEIWSFTYAKQKNVATAKAAPEVAGDTWTWTAIDADSKLIVFWLVGGRDSEYALAFMDDRSEEHTSELQSLLRHSY